ncbi:MAG: carboxyl transferase domain-containing protein [Bacteroidales bacterium]
MYQLKSNINVHSEDFQKRKASYHNLLTSLYSALDNVLAGGSSKSIKKHKSRGKLLARERIDLLVDRNTPFLEFSTLAANGQYNDEFPGAGIVTGFGLISGHESIIIANDATVKGGTYIRETIRKHVRAQEIALQNHLPVVYLVDSGGVFLPEQSRVFPDKDDFGRLFYNQARMSAMSLPQVAIVMGSCTAGGAYVPAMSDETIIVREQGTIFIGGPPLVKAATGEEVSAEDLGGAHVHNSISGVADHIAENDEHALEICRNLFASIPYKAKHPLTKQKTEEPLYPAQELYGIAPLDLKKPVDPREIIMRIVDGSRFHEFKKNYGTTLVTGFSHIMGFPAGIIGNYGVLDTASSLKGAHFVQLCQSRKIPLVFLQNISGFIVGKKSEHEGLAKHGAKLIHAIANTSIPRFTVITGGSFGAGNYAMSGRAFEPHLLFMWPNARISVMGGEQAAGVLTSVKMNQSKTKGREMSEEEIKATKEKLLRQYEHESSAWYSSSRVWDDGIIDPAETRNILAIGISMALNKPVEDAKNGVFRM